MGKNVRYAHHYDKLMDARIVQQIAQRGPLQSLTADELELDRLPLTIDPDPDPVRVWVGVEVRSEGGHWEPVVWRNAVTVTDTGYCVWWASCRPSTRT